ncbi:EAL domain-containing protein [Paraburkholderia sp. BR10937]|uniref:EAL domain-containing protein n=1 Tax=Paraburkholderia sp. BR10937 TaxID=3236994 RepID=UPI0034D1A1F7
MISCTRREPPGANACGIQSKGIAMPTWDSSSSAGKLPVEYQPIVSARSGALTGAELITRRSNGQAKQTTPEFASLFDCACADLARWQCRAPSRMALSIPISTDQLLDKRFRPLVAHYVQKHHIRPAGIRFDLREPKERDVTGIVVQRLSDLRRMGISIVLDDFGVKHSTLSSLITLPVSGLKFGRQFTASLPDDVTSVGILTNVVSLASNLGISVAIAGVENAGQLAWLGRFADLDVQGNMISRSLSSEALLYWLLRRPTGLAPNGGAHESAGKASVR